MTKILLLAKGYIRSYLADWVALFWNLLFPLILATLLSFTVGGLADNNPVETMKVGYTKDSVETMILSQMPEIELVHYATDPDDHLQTIQKDQLTAFVTPEGTLEVSDYGIQQNVLKEMISGAKRGMELGPDARFMNTKAQWVGVDEKDMDVQTLPFLSILALFAFYSYFGALSATYQMQANLSHFAARLQVSPIKKYEQLIALSLPAMVMNLINNIILIGYMHYVLKQQVITDFWATLPVLLLANFAGLGFGLLVGTSNKLSYNAKNTIGVMVLMAFATMTGLMYPAMILAFRKKMPILDAFNPVGVIQKSLVAVNQPGHLVTGTPQLGYLAILALVFMVISVLILRRRSFKSLEA